MSNLIKIVNLFYVEKENRKYDVETGLVIELEDGRFFAHAQDGFVVPFEERKKADIKKLESL